MKTIKLDRYIPELSALYSFYKYCEIMFAEVDTQQQLEKLEFESLYLTALPILNEFPEPPIDLHEFKELVKAKVRGEIQSGLSTLRRQILETAYSIFEKFLCHVVRVYFHTFPDIMRDLDKNISFRTVVELKENSKIFDHIVEQEIEHFSHRSLQKKKDYLLKHLKLTHQEELWRYEGQEMWKDIDRKRQAIVHKEETPEISHEYLLRAINYLQSIIMGIGFYAQADQGVPFEWMTIGDHIKKKDEPTLKGRLSNHADSSDG